MSETNRMALRYVAEVTYGTTPTGAAWDEVRFTGESLQGTPRTVTSNEIRSDRMISDQPKVGLDVGGGIDFELSAQDFDDFMEAAMCGTWSTNVLTVGTTDRSFSLEKEYEDLSSTLIAFKGMRVGSFGLNFAYGQLATGQVTFMGNNVTTLEATQSSAITTATSNAIMDGADGITAITIDGASVDTTYFKSIAFTLNNGLRPKEAMKYAAPIGINKGRANVTGSMTAYFDSISLYEKLISNTEVDFQFTVSDGTKTYTFRLPKIKFSSGAPAGSGVDTDVMQTLAFTGLYESSTGTSLKITRT